MGNFFGSEEILRMDLCKLRFAKFLCFDTPVHWSQCQKCVSIKVRKINIIIIYLFIINLANK